MGLNELIRMIIIFMIFLFEKLLVLLCFIFSNLRKYFSVFSQATPNLKQFGKAYPVNKDKAITFSPYVIPLEFENSQ